MMGTFGYYLIIINVVGFLLFAANAYLYTHTECQIDVLVTASALACGSAGVILGILLIDREAEKSGMLSRIISICALIVQFVLFLLFGGNNEESVSFSLGDCFAQNKWIVIIYLILINIVTFIAFAVDKYNAVKHRSRIRIATLLGLSFVGGSIGGLAAMYMFRHKTQKDYFVIGLPVILVTQIIIALFIMFN